MTVFIGWLGVNYNKILARCVLRLYGWDDLSPKFEAILKEHTKLILIFPHTSYWDSTFMIFFRLGYPEVLGSLIFLVRPDFIDIPIFGTFLTKMGGIASTCITKKNGGRTDAIVKYLNDKKVFHLAISPKGTTKRAPWKSGYYHIMKGTGAKITAVGYNYEKKRVEIFDPPDEELQKDELENWLKNKMVLLPQRNPQNLEY